MSARSRSAVATAVVVAREAGLDGIDPVVLRDAWHVLIHLRPHPVVARVSAEASSPEVEPEQVERELAVAAHAAAGGAPVVPPTDALDPGPHHRGGRIVTFWRFVEELDRPDPVAAGRGLRAIHDALADYGGALPTAGHPRDTEKMLASLPASPDVELLWRAAGASPSAAEAQALHGDAHLGNCMRTREGNVWHDFETACRGPREYDLAALVLRDRVVGDDRARVALAAYGEHDEEHVDAWLPVYGAWVWASMLTVVGRRPEVRRGIDDGLAWLRGRARRG